MTKLHAELIWIVGYLKAGNKDSPYPGKIEINLYGQPTSNHLVIDEFLEGGNKILAITGEAILHGIPP